MSQELSNDANPLEDKGGYELLLNGIPLAIEAIKYVKSQEASYMLHSDEKNFQPILNGIRPFLNAVEANVSEGVADITIAGITMAQVVQDIEPLRTILASPMLHNKKEAIDMVTSGQTGGKSFVVTAPTGTEEYVIYEDEVNKLIRQSHEAQKVKAAEYLRTRIRDVKEGEDFGVDNNLLRESILAGVFASFLPDATLSQQEAQWLLDSLDRNIAMLSANLFRNFTSSEEQATKFLQNNPSAKKVQEGTKEFVGFMIKKWESLPEDKKQNGIFAKLNQSEYFSNPENAGDLQTIRFLLFEAAIGSTVLNAVNALDLAFRTDFFNQPKEYYEPKSTNIRDEELENGGKRSALRKIDSNRALLHVAAFLNPPVDLTFRENRSNGMPMIMHLKAAAHRYLAHNGIKRPTTFDEVKALYSKLKEEDVDGLPWFKFQGTAGVIEKSLNLKNKSDVTYYLRNCSGQEGAINIGSGVLDELRDLEFVSSERVGDVNAATSGGRFSFKFRVRPEA